MTSNKPFKLALKKSPEDIKKLANKLSELSIELKKLGLDAEELCAFVYTVEKLFELLFTAGLRISVLRKFFGVELIKVESGFDKENPENNSQKKPPIEDQNSTKNTIEDADEEEITKENESKDNTDESSNDPDSGTRSKHGPNQADDFSDEIATDCHASGLKTGSFCLSPDCNGKVYSHLPDDSKRRLLFFDSQPLIKPKIYRFHDLQCNGCKKIYKANLPAEMSKQGEKKVAVDNILIDF